MDLIIMASLVTVTVLLPFLHKRAKYETEHQLTNEWEYRKFDWVSSVLTEAHK